MSVRYTAMLLSDQDVEHDEVLRAFDIEDQELNDLSFGAAFAVALSHQHRRDYSQAISAFESVVRRRQTWSHIGRDTMHFDWIEETLLELYIQQDELQRADKFFTEIVAARDEWLPEDQPNRAFTRILLARALILAKTDLDRAHTLLIEARNIVGKHAMAPDAPKVEIAQLLAQVAQAGESSNRTSK